MCEVATHGQWSDDIIARHACYGNRELVSLQDYKEVTI